MNNFKPHEIDVVVLCGGEGKRLGILTKDCPKPMMKIKNRLFLDILIDHISSFGFRRFILCVGYKAQIIRNHYEKKKSKLIYSFSEEKDLLGTAGALKNSRHLIKSKICLVLNGDSFCQIDINKFLQFHLKKNAVASIALVMAKDTRDYGLVTLNDQLEVTRFDEKNQTDESGLVSAGIYFFNTKIFSQIPAGIKYSLEYQVLPELINKGIYGYLTSMVLFDIGTPGKLEIARENLQ